MKRKLRRLRHTRPEWVTALIFLRVHPSAQINKVVSEIWNNTRFICMFVTNYKYAWYSAKGCAEIRTIGIKPNNKLNT